MGGSRQIQRRGQRGAKRDPQRRDRGIPGDPPGSLQLLSSVGEVLRRLEKAEVGPAKERQQTSSRCLILWTYLSIGYNGEAPRGNESTKTTGSHGRRERPSENQFDFRKGRSTVDAIQAMVDIATKARRGTGKHKGFCALISIDIRNAFNTARWNICIETMVRKKVPDYLLRMIENYLSDKFIICDNVSKTICQLLQIFRNISFGNYFTLYKSNKFIV